MLCTSTKSQTPIADQLVEEITARIRANKQLAEQIRAKKLVLRFSQEAKLGGALSDATDYYKISVSCGFTGSMAWDIARRAFLASEMQLGKCRRMTWKEDAAWTKF